MSDRVAVMYLGNVMELARIKRIYERPRHPYTEALLSSVPMPAPGYGSRRSRWRATSPPPSIRPRGASSTPRCPYRGEKCARAAPRFVEIEPDHWLSCHYSIN
jgi:oligopeptide/dipeptide ABC transporter ATP-binding protein